MRNSPKGEKHYAWKGDKITRRETGHKRAQNIFRVIDRCDYCGGKATERHHIDGKTYNNTRINVRFLCRRCHMKADGRMDMLHSKESRSKLVKPPRECSNCGRLYKPLRKGLCHRCNEYNRKHGFMPPVEHIKVKPYYNPMQPRGFHGRYIKIKPCHDAAVDAVEDIKP